MMKRILSVLTIALSQYLPAQETTLQDKVQAFADSPVFCHACVGIKAIRGNGETLASHEADKLLTPASNMKLISTGAALHHLGPDYKFATHIAHDGTIEDGILKGNLYIVGGADPTLGSKDSIAVSIDKVFAQWEASLRKAGIRQIDGNIIGDGRWLDGMMEEPTWLWNDIGTYYGCGVAGLNFYENTISFNASVDVSQKQAKVRLTQQYPSTSWMEITQNCSVGEKSTGDRLYMYTSDLAPVAQIRGTYGIDRGTKRVDFSNKFPEYTCAVYFKNYLSSKGITCSKGAGDFKFRKEWYGGILPEKGLGTDGDSLKTIATTWSPALERIAYETNHASNNLFAETLMRALGKELHESSCYDSSRLALNETLKQLRVDCTYGAKIQDGSGLSRQNYISADFFCRFLSAMMGSHSFEEFLWSLPIPGGDGSLNYNMKGYNKDLRSRIRVKSGSMNGVRCYSGYILPKGYTLVKSEEIPQEIKDRIIIFSILTNNCISPSWKVRPALDKLMAEMAGF